MGPNSVALLQEKLFVDFTAVDHDVSVCKALSPALRSNWIQFVHTFEDWYNIEPYTWSSYWTAADLYDRGLQLQTQILSWQQLLQTAGCTLSEPMIVPPPPGVDWSALKVIAVSLAVVGAAFVVYPVIREATATARDFRTSRHPASTPTEGAPPETLAAHARRSAAAKARQLHASVRRRFAKENPISPAHAINTYAALRARAKAYGLSERDLEVLGDTSRRFGDRRLPLPGTSVRYDRTYVKLRDLNLIQLNRESPGYSSFNDHFVLTEDGKRVLTGSGRGGRRVTPKRIGGQSRALVLR